MLHFKVPLANILSTSTGKVIVSECKKWKYMCTCYTHLYLISYIRKSKLEFTEMADAVMITSVLIVALVSPI